MFENFATEEAYQNYPLVCTQEHETDIEVLQSTNWASAVLSAIPDLEKTGITANLNAIFAFAVHNLPESGELVKILITHENMMKCGNSDLSLLAIAISERDVVMVQYLLEEGANAAREAGTLMTASITPKICKRDAVMVQYLLENGANASWEAGTLMTASTTLEICKYYNKTTMAIIKSLLDCGQGLTLSDRDKSGEITITKALRTKNWDLVQQLLTTETVDQHKQEGFKQGLSGAVTPRDKSLISSTGRNNKTVWNMIAAIHLPYLSINWEHNKLEDVNMLPETATLVSLLLYLAEHYNGMAPHSFEKKFIRYGQQDQSSEDWVKFVRAIFTHFKHFDQENVVLNIRLHCPLPQVLQTLLIEYVTPTLDTILEDFKQDEIHRTQKVCDRKKSWKSKGIKRKEVENGYTNHSIELS
jgi:hypothetical protein